MFNSNSSRVVCGMGLGKQGLRVPSNVCNVVLSCVLNLRAFACINNE